jgi:DNA-binding transcriptional ArsR family regulator
LRRGSARKGDERAGAVFAALADATRRRIAWLLSERGPLTATELAAQLPITRQAVAKHLDALEEAGLVEWTRNGRESRYRLTPEPFEAAALWMASVGAQWDRRLERLHELLGGREAQPRR